MILGWMRASRFLNCRSVSLNWASFSSYSATVLSKIPMVSSNAKSILCFTCCFHILTRLGIFFDGYDTESTVSWSENYFFKLLLQLAFTTASVAWLPLCMIAVSNRLAACTLLGAFLASWTVLFYVLNHILGPSYIVMGALLHFYNRTWPQKNVFLKCKPEVTAYDNYILWVHCSLVKIFIHKLILLILYILWSQKSNVWSLTWWLLLKQYTVTYMTAIIIYRDFISAKELVKIIIHKLIILIVYIYTV